MPLTRKTPDAPAKFRPHPVITAVAMVTLALGIAAASAAFGLINWTIYYSVPGVSEPESLALAWAGRWDDSSGAFTPTRVSRPNVDDIGARLAPIADIAAYQPGGLSLGVEGADAVSVSAQFVTAAYFDVLGVRMQVGRGFAEHEDAPGAPVAVAVISDRIWASGFSRAADVLARTIRINGLPFTIAGVAPEGFHGPERQSGADVWLPGALLSSVNRTAVRYDNRAAGAFSQFVVRLREGITRDEASARLASVGPWLASAYPTDNRQFERSALHLMGPIGVPPHPVARARMYRLLRQIGGTGLILFLFACANVAKLLRAHAGSRGLTPRQATAQGLLVGVAGGVAGLVSVSRLFRRWDFAPLLGLPVPPVPIPLDGRVAGFALGLSLAAGLLVAWHAARRPLSPRLAAGRALAAAQVVGALALLALAVASGATAPQNPPPPPLGFEPEGAMVIHVDPLRVGYTAPDAWAYAQTLAARVAAVRGVESVAVASHSPLAVSPTVRLRRPVRANERAYRVYEARGISVATPGYFDTLRVPLAQGRTFAAADIAEPGGRSRPVIVLSATLAESIFGDENPLGAHVEFVEPARPNPSEVIGVVGDTHPADAPAGVPPAIYEPAGVGGRFDAAGGVTLILRIIPRPGLLAEIRTAARRLDSSLPAGVTTLTGRVTPEAAPWTLQATLLWTIAAFACWLAAIGVYAQRQHELTGRRPAAPPA